VGTRDGTAAATIAAGLCGTGNLLLDQFVSVPNHGSTTRILLVLASRDSIQSREIVPARFWLPHPHPTRPGRIQVHFGERRPEGPRIFSRRRGVVGRFAPEAPGKDWHRRSTASHFPAFPLMVSAAAPAGRRTPAVRRPRQEHWISYSALIHDSHTARSSLPVVSLLVTLSQACFMR
jgi:hypothetical protein